MLDGLLDCWDDWLELRSWFVEFESFTFSLDIVVDGRLLRQAALLLPLVEDESFGVVFHRLPVLALLVEFPFMFVLALLVLVVPPRQLV